LDLSFFDPLLRAQLSAISSLPSLFHLDSIAVRVGRTACWFGQLSPLPNPFAGVWRAKHQLSRHLRVVLALEKSILASFRGQAPDPSWAGPLSGAQFFELIGQLIELLTSREADGSSILAERLNALEFPGHYSAGDGQPAIALGMLGWLERQQLMRALAMVLLGPGSPEFFPRRALLEHHRWRPGLLTKQQLLTR
jgi:hypothetical protein